MWKKEKMLFESPSLKSGLCGKIKMHPKSTCFQDGRFQPQQRLIRLVYEKKME